MAMPLENHAFEPQFYSRRNPSASPFWKIVASQYDDILPWVKIYLFFQLLKKSCKLLIITWTTRDRGEGYAHFQRQYPLFRLCFHFLSRLPMICSNFSDSSIRSGRKRPNFFNL